MLSRGRALKVTIHLNEDTITTNGFIYEQVFQLLFSHEIAGATMSRLEEGFGNRHQVHDRKAHGANKRHVPVRIEFVDSVDKVETILPMLCGIVSDGLIEMHETTVVKAAKQEETL